MRNDSYLKADKTNDDMYTPFYAVEPLIKYLNLLNVRTIWCPFDEDWSAFVQRFREAGYIVINTSLNDGHDFFTYEPEQYDVIISNPPFSEKDKVLKRLYELQKPFAMLLPIPTLQGIGRAKYFKQGVQLLAFDKRIGFHSPESMDEITGIPCFGCGYFCKDFLPKDLIVEELKQFSRPLVESSASREQEQE